MTRRAKVVSITIAVAFAAIIFAATAIQSLIYDPDTQSSAVSIAPPKTSSSTAASSPISLAVSSIPARLIIPALHLNAGVQYLGVNKLGNMMAPSNFTDVGWYKYGVVPGNSGSAVIDGHVDNGLGLPGVFKNLSSLAVGNDIYVVAQDGAKMHFVVTNIESYPYTQAPASIIFASTGTPQLNLITCEGTWVPGGDTYDHRLVVFSKLISST